MSKSIADLRKEAVEKYNTAGNTYDDFQIGDEVKIITPCQDFYFFYEETGVIIENKGRYLGISVKFHQPREFEDGYIQNSFNFEPQDLCHLIKMPRINRNEILRNFERTVKFK